MAGTTRVIFSAEVFFEIFSAEVFLIGGPQQLGARALPRECTPEYVVVDTRSRHGIKLLQHQDFFHRTPLLFLVCNKANEVLRRPPSP
jgi:hypothetical protein